MTPEEQAKFAGDIRRFATADIDRLHRVLFRLQEHSSDFTPDSISREYNAIYLEDRGRRPTNTEDVCLQWLLDLLQTDPETPLNEKFLDVLQEANIVLTTDGATTDGATEDGGTRDRNIIEELHYLPPRADSPDFFDHDDPLWRQAVALDNRKLASQALEQWRLKLSLKRKAYLDWEDLMMNDFADRAYKRNLAIKTISHWRNLVIEIRTMDKVADEFRMRRDAASALKRWTLATRGRLYSRVREERLLRKTLGRWRQKSARLKTLEAVADDFRNRQSTENALKKMTVKRSQIVQVDRQAGLVYEGNLARNSLRSWLAHLEQIQLNERRAEAAADYFASRHTLQRWREKASLRQEEKRARQAREQLLAMKYFRKWRTFVRKAKDTKYSEAYKTMRRKVKVNIARAAINSWRQKTAHIRQMETTSNEFRIRKGSENARRMAHSAIVAMYSRIEQIQEAKPQADLFYNRKLLGRLQVFGSNWLIPARHILEFQKKADEYRSTRTASYALSMLRSWRNAAFRARRLQDDADLLFQRNEKKRALGFLQKMRQAVTRGEDEDEGRDNSLIPATPAARRNQLLASTTPAYTPAADLFGSGGRLIEGEEE